MLLRGRAYIHKRRHCASDLRNASLDCVGTCLAGSERSVLQLPAWGGYNYSSPCSFSLRKINYSANYTIEFSYIQASIVKRSTEVDLAIFGYKAKLPRGSYSARRTSPKNASFAFIVLCRLRRSTLVLSIPLLRAPSKPVDPIRSTLCPPPQSRGSIRVSVSTGSSSRWGCFWWSRGESNPRPKHLLLHFIQQ